MFRYLFLALFLFTIQTSESFGQELTAAQIDGVRNRKLLVQIEQEDQDLIKELNKINSSLVQVYKERLATYNANLKSAIESFWTIHSELQYVTNEKIRELKKSHKNEFVIIYTLDISGTNTTFGLKWTPDLIEDGIIKYHTYSRVGIDALCITFIEDYGVTPLTYMPSNRFLPTKTEMACMIHTMNSFFSGELPSQQKMKPKEVNEILSGNCPDLKNFTILFNKHNLTADLTSEKIKSLYPYPFLILDDTEIDSIVYSKIEGYVYFYAYPTYLSAADQSYMTYLTVNCNEVGKHGACLLNPFDFKLKKNLSSIENDAKIIDEKAILALSEKVN